MTTLEGLARLLIFVAAGAAILFPFIYGLRSPWRSTPEGRMMMNLGTSIGVVFALILVSAITGAEYPGRDWVRLGAYAYLAFSLWRLVFTVTRVQHRARRGYYNRTLTSSGDRA